MCGHRGRRQRREHDPGGRRGHRHRGQGGQAGLAGGRLLGDPVQEHRPPVPGARAQQLQALSRPGPVRDAQGPHHLSHAGHLLRLLLLRRRLPLQWIPHRRVSETH